MSDSNAVIIGLDYGTTYSGIAYTSTHVGGRELDSGQVKVLDQWPPERGSQKVPTKITYSSSSKSSLGFGFDICKDDSSSIFQWTKLQLTSDDPTKELKILRGLMGGLGLIEKYVAEDRNDSKSLPAFLSKGPEHVMRDYLIKLSHYFFGQYTGNALRESKVDVVITHPVDWPYDALNQIYRAFKAAFPIRKYKLLNNVYLTTEAEAAAVYTIAELVRVRDNPLEEGDCIVLCDGGGGTVDLASFFVDSVKPLKLMKVGELQGDTCGATCVDRGFIRLCSEKLGRNDLIQTGADIGGHVMFTHLGHELLESFEKYKQDFDGFTNADIDLPDTWIDDPTIPSSGQLTISASEMRSIFKETVNKTITMIEKQVHNLRETTYDGVPLHVSVIGVVGGLSKNPYFTSVIKQWGATNGQISVRRPEHPWSAVARGSVFVGAGIGTPTPPPVGETLRYYGICVTKVHQDWEDGNQNGLVVNRFSGKTVIPDPVHWLVQRGDLILPGTDIVRKFDIDINFTSSMQRNNSEVQVVFVATQGSPSFVQDSDGPPARLSGVAKDSEIKALTIPVGQFSTNNLTSERAAKGGSRFYTARATAVIKVRKDVKVQILHQGRTISEYVTRL